MWVEGVGEVGRGGGRGRLRFDVGEEWIEEGVY